MAPLRMRIAAIAAAVVVQNGIFTSKAAGLENNENTDPFGNLMPSFSNFFGSDLFKNAQKMMEEMNKSFGFLQMKGMTAGTGASLSLSFDETEPNSCQLNIDVGGSLSANGLSIGVTGGRRVDVVYHKEETHDEHDEKKGDSHSSKTVHSSSSLTLPEKCMSSSSVLLSSLAGILVSDAPDRKHAGLIVFPSSLLLEQYITEGLLPETVVDMIQKGDQQRLAELTPLQLCLAAGFTKEQCEKLGNKKPGVSSVVPFSNPNGIPVPRYDADLQLLD